MQKAAQDATTLADAAAELLGNPSTVNDVFVAAGSLERAATSLAGSDPAAATQLKAAAAALRKGDAEAAQAALKAAAAALRQADTAQIATDTLTGAISQLAQSRTTVAQAGLDATAATNAQDRLRGLGRPGGQPGQAGATTAGAGGGAAGTPGAGQAAQSGQGTQGGAGPAADQAGQTGPAAGAQSSGGAGAANTGGNSAGTRNGSGNDSGQGAGAAPTPSGPNEASGPERVYVPEAGTRPSGTSTGPQDTIPSDSGGGGGTTDSANTVVRTGPGLKPGVSTPYQNVIGQYGDSAASALDRSALPPDAKQYVRDYFSSLEP